VVAVEVGRQVLPGARGAELADVVGRAGQRHVRPLTGRDRLGGLLVVLSSLDDDPDLRELLVEPVDHLLDGVRLTVGEEVPELDGARG
jgi:hypothetical protein